MKRLVVLSLSLGLLVVVLLSGGVDARSSAGKPGWAEFGVAPAQPTPTPGRTVSITNFQLSATPGGPATTRFSPGTTIVFIDFTYRTAVNDRVGVMIRDEFGYVLLEHEAVYTGNGRVILDLTGQRAYLAYWQATGPAGDALLLAISVTQGSASLSELRQRLAGTVALAYQYQGLLTQIQRYPLDPPAASALNQALAAADVAIAKGLQGLSPGLTEAEVRALVDQMAVEAATAVNETARARSLAGDGAGFALLGSTDAATNVANVFANGDLVQTIEWQVAAPEPTVTPTPGPGTPTTTPGPTNTPTASPTPTATPTPETVQVEIEASPGKAGYVDSRERTKNHLGAPHMFTGADTRLPIDTIFHGVFQFDLSSLPAGAQIVAAQVELTGLDDQYLGDQFLDGSGGTWRLNLLTSAVDSGWSQHGYWQLHNAPVDAVLSPVLTDADLAIGQTNVFTFGPLQLPALEARVVGSGKASFRLDGTSYSPEARHIFDWDPGFGRPEGHGPVLHVTYRQPAIPYRFAP